MGLAITTHYLADMDDREGVAWFHDQIAIVNRLLSSAQLPAHVEPAKATTRARPRVASFPYSFLHYLRRAYAYVREGEPLVPVPPDIDPTGDPLVDEAGAMFDCHLICHSDAEGFYVPVDFTEIMIDDDDKLAGGMLGSSVCLMRELVEVAPALGITLDNATLGDAEAAKLFADDDKARFYIERIVWLTLYEAARVSLADRCLIVFS